MANVFMKRCDCGVTVPVPHPKAKAVFCVECHQIRADALRAEMAMKEPLIENPRPAFKRGDRVRITARYHTRQGQIGEITEYANGLWWVRVPESATGIVGIACLEGELALVEDPPEESGGLADWLPDAGGEKPTFNSPQARWTAVLRWISSGHVSAEHAAKLLQEPVQPKFEVGARVQVNLPHVIGHGHLGVIEGDDGGGWVVVRLDGENQQRSYMTKSLKLLPPDSPEVRGAQQWADVCDYQPEKTFQVGDEVETQEGDFSGTVYSTTQCPDGAPLVRFREPTGYVRVAYAWELVRKRPGPQPAEQRYSDAWKRWLV